MAVRHSLTVPAMRAGGCVLAPAICVPKVKVSVGCQFRVNVALS
jgi:hypothetical protein